MATDKVKVCTIPLPITEHLELNQLAFNTKHIYLKINGVTFGTPHTIKKTYLGGDALLYSDDIFFKRYKAEGEKCYSSSYSTDDGERYFESKVKCISEKFSSHSNKNVKWYPIFDYHALRNNCGSMVNYIIECAGGEFETKFNFSIGDRVELNKLAKIVEQINDVTTIVNSDYGSICERARSECIEDIYNSEQK